MNTRASLGAIVGLGELKPERRTDGKTTLEMIAQTSRLALEDSGLELSHIDGLLVGPQVGETPQHVPATVCEYLGIKPIMANVVDLGGASGAGMVWRAAAAINAGMCEAVLCVLANTREEIPPRSPNRNPIREFDVPFGASGANISYALLMQAHMAKYQSTAEDFASIAAWSRKNAQLNPNAIFYNKPASLEDILNSPMIASPLHLLEIVMPVAGGEAVIVTSSKRARTLNKNVVQIYGAGEKITHRSVSQSPDLTSGPLKVAIEHAFKQSATNISDMSLLSLYDCYTALAAITIEDAGLCAPGSFGQWVRDHDLGHTGDMPYNTHGGQLGFGQPDLAGGMTHIVEAVRQLRGDAVGRQINNAQFALVTGNGATMSEATALVLGV